MGQEKGANGSTTGTQQGGRQMGSPQALWPGLPIALCLNEEMAPRGQ